MSQSSQESFHVALDHLQSNLVGLSASGTFVNASDSLISCHPDKPVAIRLGGGGPSSQDPITVPSRFTQIVNTYPHVVALKFQVEDKGYSPQCNGTANGKAPSHQYNYTWSSVTYKEYYEKVCLVARSLIAVGLQPQHSVGIVGFNSPEWFYSNFGAIFAGGLSTGIYTTNSPEACHHILSDSRANVVIVEDGAQLAKILKVSDRLPLLRAIVQYKGKLNVPANTLPASGSLKLYNWDDFLALAEMIPYSELENRLRQVVPEKCCTLIYTSGTTGNPKGVMISHDNLTWTARQTWQTIGFKAEKENILSYLPLSHVAAQIADVYIVMDTASTLWFAHPDALKGTLVMNLKDVRPTVFIGVPRVWEKIAEKMQEVGKGVRGVKRTISIWAKKIGAEGRDALMLGQSTPWGWSLANMLVFKKVRKALGLERTLYFVSTGAPLARETLAYFNSLNIPIMEIFGMSESTGPASINSLGCGNNWAGSVGLALPGTQLKIDNPDQNGVGEICINGRHVFMGYINKEKETKEIVDDDGWLRSGDLGRLENTVTGGPFLYVTGRIKELIITAGGENVAPIPIEDAIKNELKDFISNAMVVGDYKKFLSVLLTVKTEVDNNTGTPLDQLTPSAQSWASAHGADVKSVSQILDQKPSMLYQAIKVAIDNVNEISVSRAAMVKKWTILPKDFSLPGGELGPTLKLRRPIVLRMYSKLIDDLYTNDMDMRLLNSANHDHKPDSNGTNIPLKHSESYVTHI